MKSLVALLVLCAALFVGACNSSGSGSSTAPSLAPLPTDSAAPAESTPAESPMESVEASPS